MKAKGLLLLMLTLVSCDRQVAPVPAAAEKLAATQTQPAPAQATQSPQQFWSTFRAAVLAGDRPALQEIARFPFVTRGASDDDPTVPHDAATFDALLPQILAQDTGMTKEGETVRDYIERHPDLPPIAAGGGKSAPVEAGAAQFVAGPLTFEKVGKRWYWVSAYLEE
jgi:hypothetical protein